MFRTVIFASGVCLFSAAPAFAQTKPDASTGGGRDAAQMMPDAGPAVDSGAQRPMNAAGNSTTDYPGGTRLSDGTALPQVSPGLSLSSRGSATIQGSVALENNTLVLDLIGASPGYYRVRLLNTARCPVPPPPPEMVTGEVDEDQRTRPRAVFDGTGLLAGEILVPGDGRGKFTLPISARDLPKKAASVTVVLEERPGSANPSAADSLGLVACGALEVPSAG
jgi:hypothetical protein